MTQIFLAIINFIVDLARYYVNNSLIQLSRTAKSLFKRP